MDAVLSCSRVTRTDLNPARVNLGERVRAVEQRLRTWEPGRKVELIVAEDVYASLHPVLAPVAKPNRSVLAAALQ